MYQILGDDGDSEPIYHFQSGDCYEDSESRILPYHFGDFYEGNQRSICIQACEGFRYAGVQYGFQCFCGNRLPDSNLHRSNECNLKCPGNEAEICGDSWRMNIFSVAEVTAVNSIPGKEYLTYIFCQIDHRIFSVK